MGKAIAYFGGALALGLSVSAWAGPTAQGAPFRIGSCTTCIQQAPAVAGSATGAFLMVWKGASPSDPNGVTGRFFTSTGTPRAADFLVNKAALAPDQYDPAVARDAQGNFIVVWSEVANGNSEIKARRYLATGAPTRPDRQGEPGPAGVADHPGRLQPRGGGHQGRLHRGLGQPAAGGARLPRDDAADSGAQAQRDRRAGRNPGQDQHRAGQRRPSGCLCRHHGRTGGGLDQRRRLPSLRVQPEGGVVAPADGRGRPHRHRRDGGRRPHGHLGPAGGLLWQRQHVRGGLAQRSATGGGAGRHPGPAFQPPRPSGRQSLPDQHHGDEGSEEPVDRARCQGELRRRLAVVREHRAGRHLRPPLQRGRRGAQPGVRGGRPDPTTRRPPAIPTSR